MDLRLAEAHNGHHIVNTRKLTLEVEEELEPILDIVVLSYLVAESKRRDTGRATTAGASAGIHVRPHGEGEGEEYQRLSD